MKLKVSILGTEISRICRHTELTEREVMNLINEVGKLLANHEAEIVIIPCRDVSYLVAKAYKKYGGKKVIGILPHEDEKFGLEHIKPYLDVIDEKLEVPSWYHADGEIAAAGDIAICIGLSGGVIRDIGALYWHEAFIGHKTKLVIFVNTISNPLHHEIEEELSSCIYIDSTKT
ncbi:MAG: hypothetical protein QMD14_03095, partial [Candidatus Aenigmarchaeota archaeon]|nr:hypothetical protein [Candidatus Aenigmarchaeota archaeon]